MLPFLSNGLSKISVHSIKLWKIDIMSCQEWHFNCKCSILIENVNIYLSISGLLLCQIDILSFQEWPPNDKCPISLENVNLSWKKHMPGYLKTSGLWLFLSNKIGTSFITQWKIDSMSCQSALWSVKCSIACNLEPT